MIVAVGPHARRRPSTRTITRRVFVHAALGLLAACSRPPASPATANHKSRPAATSRAFIDRAPARTRLLAHWDSRATVDLPLPPLFVGIAHDCGVDIARDVASIDLAVAEPAALRVEIAGAITVEAAECVLERLSDDAGMLKVTPLARGGVRIALGGTPGDGPGAPESLRRSFRAAAGRAGTFAVAEVGPPAAPITVGVEAKDGLRIELTLPAVAQARSAFTELRDGLSEALEQSRDRGAIEISTSGSTVTIAVHKPSPEAALALRRDVIEAFKLPSGSMEPTLLVGDHVFVLKGDRGSRVKRGDVIVFRSPANPKQTYVKRILGVEGDRVAFEGAVVRLNGAALPERRDGVWDLPDGQQADLWTETLDGHDYSVLRSRAAPAPVAAGEVRVERGHVYVIGDNRDNSYDSRHFGPIAVDAIVGKVAVVWASFGPDGGFRWERVGRLVE